MLSGDPSVERFGAFAADHVGRLDRLSALVRAAIEDFGVRCFWSVPGVRDLSRIPQAKTVARLLSKHGGARGMRLAAEIEAELHALGERPWRF